jgi:signal-transduction protein with cAMP-binding, CBS, and nucleotidyltransferase domain
MAPTAQTVHDVMTLKLTTLPMSASVRDAARAMHDANIGDVLVIDNDTLRGIVTDRDLVIRVLAEGREPVTTTLADICSQDLSTVSPTDSVEHAIQLMRQKALRRLPVVENGRAVGIVSIGDLAQNRDPQSALGDISAAPPNR